MGLHNLTTLIKKRHILMRTAVLYIYIYTSVVFQSAIVLIYIHYLLKVHMAPILAFNGHMTYMNIILPLAMSFHLVDHLSTRGMQQINIFLLCEIKIVNVRDNINQTV